jgi:hypothetical protein
MSSLISRIRVRMVTCVFSTIFSACPKVMYTQCRRCALHSRFRSLWKESWPAEPRGSLADTVACAPVDSLGGKALTLKLVAYMITGLTLNWAFRVRFSCHRISDLHGFWEETRS